MHLGARLPPLLGISTVLLRAPPPSPPPPPTLLLLPLLLLLATPPTLPPTPLRRRADAPADEGKQQQRQLVDSGREFVVGPKLDSHFQENTRRVKSSNARNRPAQSQLSQLATASN